jgi:chloride channel protein, CIC family
MAAMMGGAMRAPFAAMLFALEITHDLNVLPGLLVGCIAAEVVTVLLLRRSILTEKVARRGYHIAYEYSVDPLESVRVEEVMDQNAPTVLETLTIGELSERIARGDPKLARRQATPVVNLQGALVGIITRGDVLRALGQSPEGSLTVLEACSRRLILAYPDELLRDAVEKMLKNDIGRLPVVSRDDPRHLVGYLGRTCVLEARSRKLKEEAVRERGWVIPDSVFRI